MTTAQQTVENVAALYRTTVEKFLKGLGMTEENRHEFEMWSGENDLDAEVYRNRQKVGKIETRYEKSDGGVRFVVECSRIVEKKVLEEMK